MLSQEVNLVPAQGSDARVEEVGFHVGAVIRVAFHVVDTLGMPHQVYGFASVQRVDGSGSSGGAGLHYGISSGGGGEIDEGGLMADAASEFDGADRW